DRADVLELCEGEALRRRLAHVEECVRRPLTIPRQLRAQPVVEHRPVEADLHFGCAFRPEVRVAQVRGRVRRLTAVPYGVPRADGVEGARCTPRLTPRRTQLEHAERRAPERLVRDDVRAGDLRVRLQTEVLAERGVAVDAH